MCVTSKEIAVAQWKMDIALIRGMSREDILSHDLLDDAILYVDSSTTTKASKALLVSEIVGEQSKSFVAAVKDLVASFLQKSYVDFFSFVQCNDNPSHRRAFWYQETSLHRFRQTAWRYDSAASAGPGATLAVNTSEVEKAEVKLRLGIAGLKRLWIR